jgi:rod shape-determining protein MreD
MNRSNIIQAISFFAYVFFQVLILKNAVLFHTAFCFAYIVYLLALPVETNPLVLMGVGFVLGLIMDMFYDSLGLHAFSCVLIMFLRNYWLTRLTPQGGYDVSATPGIAMGGLQLFLVYITPLVLIHHSVLFFTEVGGFQFFWFTLMKVLCSTLYTIIVILIVQYLFPGGRRI